MKTTDVFLATSSKGKIAQIKEAAVEYYINEKHRDEVPIRFHTLTEKRDLHVEEDEDTLVGNCYKKVTAYGDKYGMWTIGDDSGFFVSSLGMAPGVHSHRDGWTPKKVMQKMRGQFNRYAFIQTCAMLYHPSINGRGETRFTRTCTLEGTVAEVTPRSFGYGYDGIFVPNTIMPHTVQEVLNLRKGKGTFGLTRLLMQYPRTMAMFAIFATLDMCINS